jgi:putative addiction module killer protein
MLPSKTMVDIREYQDRGGDSAFREWYDRLNAEAARKVTTALYRVGLGNFSNAKSVGAGVYECKINFGPGYRVYFGRDGEQTVILLGGGTNSANRTISSLHANDGQTTSREGSSRKKKRGNEHDTDTRF